MLFEEFAESNGEMNQMKKSGADSNVVPALFLTRLAHLLTFCKTLKTTVKFRTLDQTQYIDFANTYNHGSQLSSPAIPPEALQYAVQQSFVYIGILQFQLFIQEEKNMNSKYGDLRQSI